MRFVLIKVILKQYFMSDNLNLRYKDKFTFNKSQEHELVHLIKYMEQFDYHITMDQLKSMLNRMPNNKSFHYQMNWLIENSLWL